LPLVTGAFLSEHALVRYFVFPQPGLPGYSLTSRNISFSLRTRPHNAARGLGKTPGLVLRGPNSPMGLLRGWSLETQLMITGPWWNLVAAS